MKGRSASDKLYKDPIIVTDSVIQHVSFHSEKYFFQIYGPLQEREVVKDLHTDLVGRVVMVGFNREDEKSIPFAHPLIPLYTHLRQ
jgi:hypothetical protein